MRKRYSFFEVTLIDVKQKSEDGFVEVTIDLENNSPKSKISYIIRLRDLPNDNAANIARQFMYMRNVAPVDEEGRPQVYLLIEKDEENNEHIHLVGTAKPFGAAKNVWVFHHDDPTVKQTILDNINVIMNSLLNNANVIII